MCSLISSLFHAWHHHHVPWTSLLIFGLLGQYCKAQEQQPIGLDALNATANGSSYSTPETAHTRQVFYLGGSYTDSTNATGFTGQVYTEQLLPVGGAKQPNPIIFFHEGFQTGQQWLQTPDNRKGWASYYLEQGYAVYLVDVAGVGRSRRELDTPANPASSVQIFEEGFTAPEKTQPKPPYPQAVLHTQFPGTGLRGDPIFDALYPSLVSTPNVYNETEAAVQLAVCNLLARIGPSFLLVHAYGGFFPYAIADACSNSVQGIVGLDADPSPFRSITNTPAKAYGLTDIPLTYSPPINSPSDLTHAAFGTNSANFSDCELQSPLSSARKLPNLANIPIMNILTEAGPHAVVGHCQPTFLRQAGATVSLVYLAEVGIRGNGQLMYLEKNNLDIAVFIGDWFQARGGQQGRQNLTDISTVSGKAATLSGLLGLGATNGTGSGNGTMGR